MSELEQKLSGLSLGGPSAVTLGTFDGVHRGHRRLLEVLKTEAANSDLISVAVTFRRPPRSIIDPASRVAYLATLEHRIDLLREIGVENVLPVDFDSALQAQPARAFIDMLRSVADVRLLVTGPGATIGNDRVTAGTITEHASSAGMRVLEAPAVEWNGRTVSSSAIRGALSEGDVQSAASMLGRNYCIDGKVVTGDRRGRELGFPTANIEPSETLAVPADGIYASIVSINGERHMAATSIGIRPTFGGGERKIESYVLDFDEDLYGRNVRLEFVERLRGEIKFDGVDALIDQMNRDVSDTRSALSGAI